MLNHCDETFAENWIQLWLNLRDNYNTRIDGGFKFWHSLKASGYCGILTIAIADAFSDALGIHISEESEGKHTPKEIWESTISTFLSKSVFAMTFVVPVLLLPLKMAIIVSVVWGLSILGIFSFHIAKEQKVKSWKVVIEHLVIALVVIIITHYIGGRVFLAFG